MASGAPTLDPHFRDSQHPSNSQLQRRKIDFCGYDPPNYFSRLVPECLTQKILVPYLLHMCVILLIRRLSFFLHL